MLRRVEINFPTCPQTHVYNWLLGTKSKYHDLVSMGNDAFLSFVSTYFCDMSSLVMAAIKLNLELELKIATLEGVKVRFKKMKHIQSHHFS